MSRNKDRLGLDSGPMSSDAVPAFQATGGPLTFSTPTEFVELPSEGKHYNENHPLHGQSVIEIRHMTAKEEDILSSKTLLKKGLALDRFMQSVIVDKSINVQDLLVGDRNAILIAARATGYGEEYETQVVCPACKQSSRFTFDLGQKSLNKGGDELENITWTDRNTFVTKLPVFGVDVELRMLTGKDEQYLAQLSQNKKNKNLVNTTLTDQLRMTIASVNGRTEQATINSLIDNLPAKDSKHLRTVYAKASPNIDLSQKFECSHCFHEDVVEVPLTAEFFWPK